MPIKGIARMLAAAERELANETNTWWPDPPCCGVLSLTQLGGGHSVVAGWVETSLHRGEGQVLPRSWGSLPLIPSCQAIFTSSVVSCKEKNESFWARSWEDCMSLIPWPLASSVSQVNYFPHFCFIFLQFLLYSIPAHLWKMVAANTSLWECGENGLCGWCIWNSIKEMGCKSRSHRRETIETGKFCCWEVINLLVVMKCSWNEAWLR